MVSASLSEFGNFTKDDLSLFESELQFLRLSKQKYLVKEGSVCTALYYLKEGSLIHFITSINGEELIANLYTKGNWITEFHSFTSQKPSAYTIQAFEDCELFELNVESLHKLIIARPAFLVLGKIFENTGYPNFTDYKSPKDKYDWIIKEHPELILKFPLKYIASYLKITPETLSRVRAKYTL